MLGPIPETSLYLIGGRQRYAWTGGSSPDPWEEITDEEKCVVVAFYLEQWRFYTEYWREAPHPDTKSIFWGRARHDAHATLRGWKREEGR